MKLSAHRNAVSTIAIGLEAPFELRLGERTGTTLGDVSSHHVAVIPGHSWHHLSGHGAMAFLYFDAAEGLGAASTLTPRHARTVRAMQELLDGRHDAGANAAERIAEALGLPDREEAPEPIGTVARAVAANPDEFARIDIAARLAGLSPSRFQHVFTRALGVPFGRYRQWCRMGRVARTMAAGGSLTHAALDAGFSSSAHLSAAFRTMFGIKPSDLVAAGVRFQFDDAGEPGTRRYAVSSQ